MYDISSLLEKERELKKYFKEHFISFFKNHDYQKLPSKIKFIQIRSHSDLLKVRCGAGLYLLLSDFDKKRNPCKLEVNNLKVIYRGHGARIRKRVESHIFNDEYRNNQDRTTYSVCMKIHGLNGINVDQAPFSTFGWAVIYHPMTNSTKIIREQAEQAFDDVYGMPLGSYA